jgi:hypothetical protein
MVVQTWLLLPMRMTMHARVCTLYVTVKCADWNHRTLSVHNTCIMCKFCYCSELYCTYCHCRSLSLITIATGTHFRWFTVPIPNSEVLSTVQVSITISFSVKSTLYTRTTATVHREVHWKIMHQYSLTICICSQNYNWNQSSIVCMNET